MDFRRLLTGVFDGLIQVFPDVWIGPVCVDFFLPEWNIVILQSRHATSMNEELIRNKILEFGGDDFPVVFFYINRGMKLKIINSILRIASMDLYWCPNGHEDHSEWVQCLGFKESDTGDNL